jgi:hypothetical protein
MLAVAASLEGSFWSGYVDGSTVYVKLTSTTSRHDFAARVQSYLSVRTVVLKSLLARLLAGVQSLFRSD